MTKVVHVTAVHSLLDSRIFHKECLSLRDAGYDVTLIAPHECDETVDGIMIRSLPQSRNRRDRVTRLARLAYKLCIAERGDIYHFHDLVLLPWMARLKRIGKPVIFDMHENATRDMLTKRYIPALLRPLVAVAVRLGLRHWLKDMPVVFAEQSYGRDYPWIKHSIVVQNMPRVEELTAIRTEKQVPPTVGYFGSVTELRGSLKMLAALAILKREGCPVGFECVGHASAAHRAELEQTVARYGLEHVRFHGRIAQREGWQLMAGCVAGVALLADIPNYRESYPTKLFEYMALGLPVVVSGFPLYRNVVDSARCGLCVDPADPEKIAAALKQICESPGLAKKMGEHGRQAVIQHYTWTAEESKLLEFYKTLLVKSD